MLKAFESRVRGTRGVGKVAKGLKRNQVLSRNLCLLVLACD